MSYCGASNDTLHTLHYVHTCTGVTMKNDALNALIVDLVIENRGLKNQIKTWESLGVTQEMRIYELEDQLRDYKADDLVAKMAEDNEEVK